MQLLKAFRLAAKPQRPRRFHVVKKIYFFFLGFAPADDPQVLALIIINNPQGVYYGGTIAAPVCRDLFSNILPYLGIEQAPVTEDAEIQENP